MSNQKWRAPKIAITRKMIESGLTVLEAMTADGEDHTDDALVANIFFCMWETYHKEIEEVRRKKQPGSAIIKPGLILPFSRPN